MVPIIIPINTTHAVDCITSSGKTYCERSNVNSRDAGFLIIGSVVWFSILMYLIFKSMDEDISGWFPAGFVILSFILLGLTLIFI
jgi:hypothetical protein